MIRQHCVRSLLLLTASLLLQHNQVIAEELQLVYSIDFSQLPDGTARPWLEQQGYFFELDAYDLDMQFKNGQLVIQTQDSITGIAGLQLEENKWIHGVTEIEIEWGVLKQPDGANWEESNNRVPIALMFFFGSKKINSGLPFGINSAPYFISPFIGKLEKEGKTYTGKLYRKGGRYVCIATTDGNDELISSTLKIDPKYLNLFNKTEIPPITGIAFQMNTKDTSGGASAFIKRVNFLTVKKDPS